MRTLDVLRLHLNRRLTTWGVPVIVLVGLIAIFLVIFGALTRATGAVDVTVFGGQSGGILQGLFWYMFASGVVSLVTNYPLARALGAGRRGYLTGTVAYMAVASLYLTALCVAASGIERLTGGWFMGVLLFDGPFMGGGSIALMIALCMLIFFMAHTLGGAFGAMWLRFGTMGVWAAVLASGAILAVAFWIIAPDAARILAGITQWQAMGLLAGVAALCALLTGVVMRGVVVRNA